MSRVDVIMATYNGEKYVSEQIHSVLRNTDCSVYVHVFDDGSTDQTLPLLETLKKDYPGHILVYQNETNLGVTRNFLTGISKVMSQNHEAQYFMLCDQDDIWHTDKIRKTLKRMRQMEKRYGAERPLLVFTDATLVNESLETIHTSFFKSQHLTTSKTGLAHILMENKCIGCTIMINRGFELYLRKTPKEARYHDWWLALIAATFGNISYVNCATLLYRQHGNNVVGGMDYTSYIKNRMKMVKCQKESLRMNQKQAIEFYDMFDEAITMHKRMIIEEFIELFDSNFILRRLKAISGGYLKSGLIRNIGLMLYL